MSKSIQIDKERKVVLIKGWNQIFHFYYAPIGAIGFAILGFIFDFPSLSLPVLFLAMALIFFLLQKRLTKMKEYKVDCSQNQLEKAFSKTAKIREWDIEVSNGSTLQAFDKDFFNFYGGGDLIIVTKTKSGFLITTLPDPREMVNPFFTPLRKNNRREFINQLKGVIKGQTSTSAIDSSKSEWTIKKILFRLIAYPFCIALIWLGVRMIGEPLNWKSQGAGVGAILAASVYLYFDIKSIMKKTNAQHEAKTNAE